MIHYLELNKVNQRYRYEIDQKLKTILDKGWYLLGDEIEQFEVSFATYCKTKYAIGVASGLDALRLILKAYKELGILKDGDEVIVPSFTFIATALAVSDCGLKPIFVDINEHSFNIDPNDVRQKISKNVKAIIAVHLFGQPANMDELKQISEANNLILIEDAAQAHGADYDGQRVGSLAAAAAFSFYPGKNLGCMGDGGAITTNNSQINEVVRALRNYGSEQKYQHQYQGLNSRLSEMQAGVLSVKLKYLDNEITHRQQLSEKYLVEINNQKLKLPCQLKDRIHVWHIFGIITNYRDELMNYLQSKNIQTQIHYPAPVHKQLAYSTYNSENIPNSESIAKSILSIPLNSALKENEQDLIINALNEF